MFVLLMPFLHMYTQSLTIVTDREIVYLHFHVKNTIINVVVRTIHNTHESIGNPDSEVANKAGCW